MTLDLTQPQVMGILNITPDSFSDGGQLWNGGRLIKDAVLTKAQQMVLDGAAILDIGGESTRPGAAPVSLQQELDRVIPVLEILHAELAVPLSVDTSKLAIMRAAVIAGADLINDVRALTEPGTLEFVAQAHIPVCLMHMLTEPPIMQVEPQYQDVVTEVYAFLVQRIQAALTAGIAKENVLIDPGFGFGKTLQHNLSLLKSLDTFTNLGVPLLVGLSRKAMIGHLLGLPVAERLAASLALAVWAVSKGAVIIRTHDVKPTVEAVKMVAAILQDGEKGTIAYRDERCHPDPDCK
ncbi:dihydropteroate synthase [soil metagenome]